MEQKKAEIIERGIIGKYSYHVIITFHDNDNLYHGTAICNKPNSIHAVFSNEAMEVVYMECIEWLNDNSKN
jgi:hypothetical protein